MRSGDHDSASEVIREALRVGKVTRLVGRLWDEGLVSGRGDNSETIDDIKVAARRRPTGD